MKNGQTVAAFERAFAECVKARYAIALSNGTVTLHTALAALGVGAGDRVGVPPLTMSSTSISVLNAGGTPVFLDIHPETWLMEASSRDARWLMPVSLYGLHAPSYDAEMVVDDAAETLRPHNKDCSFTSYSLQASKIISTGEGGVLVTDDEALATKAREFSSLGYRMKPEQPRIDPATLKSPDYARHYSLGINARMNDVTAELGLRQLERADNLLAQRRHAATVYRQATEGCQWITHQLVPDGWQHDYWAFSIAVDSEDLWHPFVEAIVANGGERPYAAWRLTYAEPAFTHLAKPGTCPVAEDLQTRLVQFQTNDPASVEKNAAATRLAIKTVGGTR